MARTQTMVQLTDDLVARLDEEAAARAMSRSALIREVIEAHLTESRSARIGRIIAEGYRRIPPGTPDEWGSLEVQAERSASELGQRLDAEEKAQGHEEW